MTVKCLHCGPVDVTDPITVRHYEAIMDTFAVGGWTHAAITCPLCSEEIIFPRDVVRDAVAK